MKLKLSANIKRARIFLVGVALIQNFKIPTNHFVEDLTKSIIEAKKKNGIVSIC